MVRSISGISMLAILAFMIGCGPRPKPATPIGQVGPAELLVWPRHRTTEPIQRASAKPANIIVTVAEPEGPGIAWVTSDGTDLLAVYCVAADLRQGVRARAAEQRRPEMVGYAEIAIQPGLVTDICGAPAGAPAPAVAPSAVAPPAPAPPELPPLPQLPCRGDDANCNYVILSPGKTGPPGLPPWPDLKIFRFLDVQLQKLQIFRPASHGRGIAGPAAATPAQQTPAQ